MGKIQAGQSIRSAGKELGIDESTVRGWKRNQEKLRSFATSKKGNLRTVRRVGSGKSAAFPVLEQRLITWVELRNKQGLRVKQKFIIARAKALRDDLILELSGNNAAQSAEQIKALRGFTASTSWCTRFKNRHELVTRRHTTSRTLPEDFPEKARDFLSEVQDLISFHKIEPHRIVNFDQVPRYFETENNSTIIKRGTKEITLRKASTSHKRFTFTPVINADGDILAIHLLFANLKNVPKVVDGCLVDVNQTGMWNEVVLTRTVEEVMKKCQSPFKEPVLILLDSYGTHIKFVQEKGEVFKRKNVFFKVIPGKMTGLLQPLDVSINRGFQQHYNDCYNEYLTAAINSTDPAEKTRSGNVKMPSYLKVSEWVLSWKIAQSKEGIAKSFVVCGLMAKESFSLEGLHKPLRDCFADEFSNAEWEEEHQALARNADPNNPDIETGNYLIFNEKFSLFKAVYQKVNSDDDYDDWLQETLAGVRAFIEGSLLLSSLFSDHERELFDGGLPTDTQIELYAIAEVLNIKLKVSSIDRDFNVISKDEYNTVEGEGNVDLVLFENNYGVDEEDVAPVEIN